MPTLVRTAIVPRMSRKITLNPSSIDNGVVATETFTVAGLRTNMFVLVSAPNLETGVKVVAARCSAANTLELTFWNFSGGTVNPASQVFFLVAL